VYVTLTQGANGFGEFGSISLEPPPSGDYLRVQVVPYWDDDGDGSTLSQNRVGVILPFDRYYMNEKAAPAAEQAYREHSSAQNHNAYVTVRVWKGHAVLEGLYVADQRIEDYLEAADESSTR